MKNNDKRENKVETIDSKYLVENPTKDHAEETIKAFFRTSRGALRTA